MIVEILEKATLCDCPENTSKLLDLKLEKRDQVLSSADCSPLSVLGKSEVLLESKAKVYLLRSQFMRLKGLDLIC